MASLRQALASLGRRVGTTRGVQASALVRTFADTPRASFSAVVGDINTSEHVAHLLSNLARLGECNKAFAVSRKANDSKIPLTTDSYNALIAVAARASARNASGVYKRLYEVMRDTGIQVNGLTYALVMESLQRATELQEGEEYHRRHNKRQAVLKGLELCDAILADEQIPLAEPTGEVDPWGQPTLEGFKWLMHRTSSRRMEVETFKVFRCLQLLGISPDDDCYRMVRLSGTVDFNKHKYPKDLDAGHMRIPRLPGLDSASVERAMSVSPQMLITDHPSAITYGFGLAGYDFRKMQMEAAKEDQDRQALLADIERLKDLGLVSTEIETALERGSFRWCQPETLRSIRDGIAGKVDPKQLDVQAEFERVTAERKLLEVPPDPRKTEYEL